MVIEEFVGHFRGPFVVLRQPQAARGPPDHEWIGLSPIAP
jgi:hypothetical protein